MAVAATAVGVVGNIISILMFLAPVKTFRKIFKSKSTQEFKATPYVCTLLSVMLWTFYGLVKPGLLIVTINVAGCALQASYLVVYFFYADKRRRIREMRSLAAVSSFFALVVVLTLTVAKEKSTRLIITGVISVIFSIMMYASPLRVMKLVIQTKSVTYMPFTLSTLQFINGCVWLIYALLVKDLYVGIPNGVGLILGATQITLYVIYMNASKKQAIDAKKRTDSISTMVPDPIKATEAASVVPNISNTKETPSSMLKIPRSDSDRFVSVDINGPPHEPVQDKDSRNLQEKDSLEKQRHQDV